MTQDSPRDGQNRRRFLKTAGLTASSLSFAPVGTAAANPDSDGRKDDDNRPDITERTKTLRVTPDTPGLSKSEHEAYVDAMREKYGDAGVWGIEPDGPSTQGSSPGHTENLSYINAWVDHLEVETDNGRTMVSADYQVALYKTDVQDSYGRDHYYYWQWGSAQSHDYWDFEGNIREMYNRVRLDRSYYDLLIYDPDSDINRNGTPVTIELSAEYKGVGVGISGDFVLNEDTVRPHPTYSTVGGGGEFAVQWVGNYEGTQGMNGACEERRPGGYPYDFYWQVYLKGSKY